MAKFELTEQKAIELGTYLKNKREKLGYSTNYIEMHTGINKADISRIEKGKKKKINALYLKELANILKLNQIELFNIAGFIEDKYFYNSNFKGNKVQSLAVVIKQLREKRELSQAELAKKAGIASGTIGDIERGVNKSTVKTLNKISKALQLTEFEKNKLDNAFMGRELRANILYEKLELLDINQQKIIEMMIESLLEKNKN